MIAHRSSAVKVALLAVALVVALSSDAAATHSNGTGPKMDFVFGTGIFRGLDLDGLKLNAELHVNAKSESDGTNPEGHFFVRLETSPLPLELDFRGTVTCLEVSVHTAIVGGKITQSRLLGSGFAADGGILIRIDDPGEPGAGRDAVSFAPSGIPLTVCPSPDTVPQGLTIDQGNFVVHDAECRESTPPCID
jgi:hypothetical protein